ncbi:MAG TPA: hypothetical protein DDW52_16570, partial [Planctomycetaceae bacterium]|nr:hypothetical protein [Planctomycetaceae bacterium]
MNVISVVTLYLLTCQVAPYGGSIGDQRPALGSANSLPLNYPDSATSSRGGQTGAAGLPSSLPVQPSRIPGSTSSSIVPDDGHITSLTAEQTFGWDRDRDGKLYYIIQLSPDHAKIMLSEYERGIAETIEQASTMPVELVGHVSRIAVRVGTKVLPRNPSLEVIRGWGPVAKNDIERTLAGLGNGRLAEVEQPAMTVQQPLPEGAYPRPTTGSNSSTLGDKFLSDARNLPSNSRTGQTGTNGPGYLGGLTDSTLASQLPASGLNNRPGLPGGRADSNSSNSLPDYSASTTQSRPNSLNGDPPSLNSGFGASPRVP